MISCTLKPIRSRYWSNVLISRHTTLVQNYITRNSIQFCPAQQASRIHFKQNTLQSTSKSYTSIFLLNFNHIYFIPESLSHPLSVKTADCQTRRFTWHSVCECQICKFQFWSMNHVQTPDILQHQWKLHPPRFSWLLDSVPSGDTSSHLSSLQTLTEGSEISLSSNGPHKLLQWTAQKIT